MKEHKFKLWNITDKMWLTSNCGDFYITLDGKVVFQCHHTSQIEQTEGIAEIKILQYTGLKDINDKEIYEGYIVKCQELRNDILAEYISEVFFEDGCWLVHENKNCDVELYLYDNTNPTKSPLTEIEIIGNIYENPELLKEELK